MANQTRGLLDFKGMKEGRVPLIDELGIDSRLDLTHAGEYREEQLVIELNSVGMIITQSMLG